MTFSLYDEPVNDDEAAKTMEALNSYESFSNSRKSYWRNMKSRFIGNADGLRHRYQ